MDYIKRMVEIFKELSPAARREALAWLARAQKETPCKTKPSADSQESAEKRDE